MKERRSSKINKHELVLKSTRVHAVMIIPAGWSVAQNAQDSFNFSFKRIEEEDPGHPGRKKAKHLRFDPYVVREKFMGIETPDKALGFFKKFGPLDVAVEKSRPRPSSEAEDLRPMVEMVPGAAGVAQDITFDALLELQELYRKALLNPKYKFTDVREIFRLNAFQSPKFQIDLRRPLTLWAESAYVSEAIYTTLYLDRLAGLRSVKCPECHKIVRQENQHLRRFCSTRCGNLSRKKKLLSRRKGL